MIGPLIDQIVGTAFLLMFVLNPARDFGPGSSPG
jgi:hypothetical protein